MANRTPMEDRELAYLEELVKTSVLTHAQTERLATLKRKGEEPKAFNGYNLGTPEWWAEARARLRTRPPTVLFSTPLVAEQHERWLPRGLREWRQARETAEEHQAALNALRDPLAASRQARMEEAIASAIHGHEPTLMAFDEASGVDRTAWFVHWGDAQIADLLPNLRKLPKRTLRQRIRDNIGDKVHDARLWLSNKIYALADWIDPHSPYL